MTDLPNPPSPPPLQDLLSETASRAARYLAGLDTRGVAPDAAALAGLAALAGPLPERGMAPHDVLRRLDDHASPATMASAGGRFFGFVTGGSLPATLAAHWLATAWDQNSALHSAAPATSALEATALDWLRELLGLPPATAGAFVTGATMANFSALAAARHAVLARAGWDVEADGLAGAPPIQVIVGQEAHATLAKSLSLLGIGRRQCVPVPVDSQGRMLPGQVPRLQGPVIICAQSGNVNTGAFDPLPPLVEIARAAGAWLHVDGAFGLWAAASPPRRHLVAGLADVDSCATDAHKWLNVPYDSGLAFVRDASALHAAMAVSAAYLTARSGAPAGGAAPARNPSDTTPELSRRARGVDVWAALCSLGREGVAQLVDTCCRLAQRFAAGLAAAGHAVLNEVVLNQVLVRFGDAETTLRVIAAVQAEGSCWCGATVWQGHTAMRISVSSWATTDADVERSLSAILRTAAACGA